MTQSRELLIERKALESDLSLLLLKFFKKQKGYPFNLTKFHKDLVSAYQSVLDGEVSNLLIHVPPRLGKTEIATYFCAAGFARNAASEFIYSCSDNQLALDCSSKVRSIVRSPEFRKYWNIGISSDTDAKGLWRTNQGGSFWAGGSGAGIVGYGAGKHPAAMKDSQYKFAGCIICDDILKEQDRFRTIAREEAITYITDTLPARRNNGSKTPMVIFMQPLHKDDPGQWIKQNRPDFKVVEFPIMTDNVPLVPEIHTLEDLLELKATTSNEIWQAKYMLSPIKLGGNLLKTKFLKYYDELPLLKHRWLEVDTAQKTEERHDYTVFQCWGKGHDGGIFLIDQFRKKVEYSDLKQSFKDFWNKHNSHKNYDVRLFGYLTRAFVEDKSSGTQIIQEARREGEIPVEAVQRSKSKYERAVTAAVPKLEAGFINIPAKSDFNSDLKEELESFTGQSDSKQAILKIEKKKTWDDQVDCLISACEHGFTDFVQSSKIMSKFMNNKLRKKR